MIHYMNLDKKPFEMIKSREKTIELRLNDEKRRLINIGDFIVFTNLDDYKKIIVKVLALYKFNNFEELYNELALDKCGYKVDEIKTAKASDMLECYSLSEQEKYGVLGIEIVAMKIDEVIKIIDMSEAYYEQKAYVHYQSWIETYTGLMNQEYLDKMTLEKCSIITKKYPENTIIAIFDNKVIAFAAYNKARDDLDNTGEIYAIYVLKTYQKLGIGKLLLNECFKRLNEYQKIVLYVLENNINSINWYKYHGFTFDGYLKNVATSIKDYYLKEKRMVHDKS